MKLLLIAIAPSIAIALIFYLRDKYDREPLGLLVKTFLWGAATIVPVGIVESMLFDEFGINIFENNGLAMTLFSMVFLVAMVEESAKFCVVRWYCWNKKSIQ